MTQIDTKGRILKATSVLSLSTFITLILGYLRDMIMVYRFGSGEETDAWFIASTIPELFHKVLFLGAVGAVFVPTFTSAMKEGEKRAWRLASSVVNIGALAIMPLLIIGMVFPESIVSILAPGFSPPAKEVASELVRVLLPVVLITWLSGMLGNILHVYGRFLPSGVAPVINSTILLLSLIFLSGRYGIASLAYGSLVGALAGLLCFLLSLRKRITLYTPSLLEERRYLKDLFLLMLPVAGAELIGKGIGVVDRIFASTLEAGSITDLQIALKVVSLPLLLFSRASSIVLYPYLSHHTSRGSTKGFKDLFLFGIKVNLFISIPSTIGLFAMGRPFISALFERGAFTSSDTYITANLLYLFTAVLVFQMVIPLLLRGFYSLGQNWVIFRYETSYFLVNVILDLILIRYFGIYGIALATALIVPVLAIYLLYRIHREVGGMEYHLLLPFLKKVLFSALLMGWVIYYLTLLVPTNLPWIILEVILGAGLYILILFLLKTEELNKLLSTVRIV